MTNTLAIIITILLSIFIGIFLGIMIAQAYIIPKPQFIINCYNTSNLTALMDLTRNVS